MLNGIPKPAPRSLPFSGNSTLTDLWLEIHPHDAKALNISPSDWVQVQSLRGQVKARARISATIQPGQVFLPMHHRDVNTLTHGTFDPHSRQPSYKACAVRVTK